MSTQVGVIVPGESLDVEAFKKDYIEKFENVDPRDRKPMKLEFIEKDGYIEVMGE
jgi:hypothetical protein